MREGSRFTQYYAATAAALCMIFQGVIIAWPSPVMPKLLPKGPLANSTVIPVQVSYEQWSWVVSLITVGGIPGCFLAQVLADTVGRKLTILATAIPATLGAGMILFATIPELLYVARFLTGLAGAMIVVAVTTYIPEVADKEVRGALGTLSQAMANVGNLLMYCVGPFVSYHALNALVLAVPFCCAAACLAIPESPYFYLKANDMRRAERSLRRLKGMNDAKRLEAELEKMRQHVQRDSRKKAGMLQLFRREYFHEIMVVLGLKVLQQMTGTIVLQSYLQNIFSTASDAISGPNASIIYGVVQFCAGLVSTVLADRLGRRPLLMISSVGVGLSLFVVALYFFLKDYMIMKVVEPPYAYIPVAAVLLFNVLYAVGIGTLPYLMQAELFPTNVKSAASSFATMLGAVLAFIVAKSYQDMQEALGIYTVFWIFSAIGLGGGVFIYVFVPETKGKSLEEIDAALRGLHNPKVISIPEANGETKPLQKLNDNADEEMA